MRRLLGTLWFIVLVGCSSSASDAFTKGMEAYGVKDYATAFPLVSTAARDSHVEAMAILGVMHLFGQGTPINGKEAERWLRKASDSGFTEAQSTLGIMYATGAGVERNLTEARRLLTLAADKGDKHAIMVLKQLSDDATRPDQPGRIL